MSSALTLDSLCDDVLLKMFGQYLDLRSQLRVQQVCKRFNGLIGQHFAGKRSLLLSDGHFRISSECETSVGHYWRQSVKSLYALRDDKWTSYPRGLHHLSRLDIQLHSLNKYQNIKELCLVANNEDSNETSLLDLLAAYCGPNVRKLIIISNRLNVSLNKQIVDHFCHRFSRLTHFEFFVNVMIGPKECFERLLNGLTELTAIKLRVRLLTTQLLTNHIVYDENYFNNPIDSSDYSLTNMCFAQMGHRFTTIDVFNNIIDNESIQWLAQNACLNNVKHLGVHELVVNSMQAICDHMSGLESLSFSMDDTLDAMDCRVMLEMVGQLTGLKTLKLKWFGSYSNTGPKVCRTTLNGLMSCHTLKTFIMKDAIITSESIDAMSVCLPSLATLELINCASNKTTFHTINGWLTLRQLIVGKKSKYCSKKQVFSIDHSNPRLAEDITADCVAMNLMNTYVVPMAAHLPQQEDLNLNDLVLFDNLWEHDLDDQQNY